MDLKKLHTKQVLKLYRQLKAERSEFINYSNCEDDEEDKAYLAQLTEQVQFVKKELNTREHIPTKAEAKKIRQEKAKRKK